jgi:hypothetical protein
LASRSVLLDLVSLARKGYERRGSKNLEENCRKELHDGINKDEDKCM